MPDNKIDLIVKILLDEEHNLSDGYQYYCGDDNKETKLTKIANLILELLNKQEKNKKE